MKTAMQELIEHIQTNATKISLMNTYNILKEIEPYLEKEKNQVIKAVDDTINVMVTAGFPMSTTAKTNLGELYFNQTYNEDVQTFD